MDFTQPPMTKAQILNHSAFLRAGMFPSDVIADDCIALLVMHNAHWGQKTKNGDDYTSHPFHISQYFEHDHTKKMMALLHDVVENSDWTFDDLRKAGFSDRIVDGIDALSRHKKDNELYFDFIERCSLNPDALAVKLADIDHNLDESRHDHLLTEKAINNINKYKIAKAYLTVIQEGLIEPGSPITDFINSCDAYCDHHEITNLLNKYSSHSHMVDVFPGTVSHHFMDQRTFDSVENISRNPFDIDDEIAKIELDLDLSENYELLNYHDILTINKNKIYRAYLVAVKNGNVVGGSSVIDFINTRKDYRENSATQTLIAEYATRRFQTPAASYGVVQDLSP